MVRELVQRVWVWLPVSCLAISLLLPSALAEDPEGGDCEAYFGADVVVGAWRAGESVVVKRASGGGFEVHVLVPASPDEVYDVWAYVRCVGKFIERVLQCARQNILSPETILECVG